MEHCARLVRKLAPRRQALHRALEGFLVSREVRPTTKPPVYAAMTPTAQLRVLNPNAMPYGTDIMPNPQPPRAVHDKPDGLREILSQIADIANMQPHHWLEPSDIEPFVASIDSLIPRRSLARSSQFAHRCFRAAFRRALPSHLPTRRRRRAPHSDAFAKRGAHK